MSGADGTLSASFHLLPQYHLGNDEDAPKILVEMHGSLLLSQFSACVAACLSAMIDELEIADRVTESTFEEVGVWPPESQERFRRLARDNGS
jgi:hypothetical protein